MLPRFELDLHAVLGTTGIVLLVMGGAQLVPVAVAASIGAPTLPLLLGALGTGVVGALLASLRKRARRATRRESLGSVVLAWAAATLAGAVPYLVTGAAGPLDAAFESLSGLTTTGGSIFVDVDALRTSLDQPLPARPPLALHAWRSLTHWIGGAGIVLIVFLLTPFLGDAETLRHTQRQETSFLTARYRGSTRATLRSLLVVYVGLTLLLTLLLALLGVSPLDALLHAFSSIATGGFSTHTTSLATWDDRGPWIKLVTLVFMVTGALNFAVLGRAYEELRQEFRTARAGRGAGRAALRAAGLALPVFARAVYRNVETRAYVGFVLAGAVAVALVLATWEAPRYADAGGLSRAAIDGAFNVASMSTTTGFATEDFATWPPAAQALIFLVLAMGGCSGSTAGGLKMRRVLILLLCVRREVRRCAHPRAAVPLKLGDEVLSEEQVREALAFTATYLGLIVAFTIAVTATGADLVTASSTTASAFASAGPGLGACGPHASYQVFAPEAKALLMMAMILGRLEVYPVLTACTPSFWLRRTRPRSPLVPGSAPGRRLAAGSAERRPPIT